jgi:L-threonylcarbamoyladenylate synthase
MTAVDVRQLGAAAGAVERCLQDGGVVLLPTDTVYGLAALPEHPEAAARIFALKGRPSSVKLQILVADPGDIERLGGIVSSSAARLLVSRFVPGPLTLAVGIDPGRAPDWLAGRVEAAFRLPAEDWLLGVIRAVGPVYATSANIHAGQPKEAVAGILPDLAGQPDLAIDGGVRATVASTLVNCNVEPATIERVGAVPAAEIEAILA